MSINPGIGCRQDGQRKPFQIFCNGDPYGGYETEQAALHVFNMYASVRPGRSFRFTLQHNGKVLREVTSPTAAFQSMKIKK